MASSFWEAKYLSAQKSIDFLQDEHAKTLKALHEQIETLQKQCSDFSFKLSLTATNSAEEQNFLDKHRQFNVELKEKDSLLEAQKKNIDEKNKSIKTLQDRVVTLEKRLDAETKFKDDTIRQLKIQLNQQSTQLAHMTFKALSTSQNKLKLSKDFENDKSCSSSISSTSDQQRVPQQFVQRQTHFSIHPSQLTTHKSNNSASSSSDNDKILIQPVQLPLKIIRNKSKMIPPPHDHKSFLLTSSTSTKSDEISGETVIVKPKLLKHLPPIKTTAKNEATNQIAIELPHKASAETPLSNNFNE